MRGKRRFRFLAAVVLLITVVLLFRHWSTRGTSSPTVTLRFVAETNYIASGVGEPIFWATNHLDKWFLLKLEAIEIQSGRTWTDYYTLVPPGALYFTNQIAFALAPHAAGYCGLRSKPVHTPTNAVWRARVSAVHELKGFARTVTAIQHERETLRLRRLSGETNLSANPLSKGRMWFGHPSIVTSQEVAPP
jgi:hypothetical protein